MSNTATGFSLVYAHPSGGLLFQGGEEDAKGAIWAARSPSPEAEPFRVHLLVLCAEEVQPRTRSLAILSVPLRDRLFRSSAEARAVTAMARQAASVVAARVVGGERVVTCAVGLNRSALCSGLALKLLGVEGASAVRKIRRARAHVGRALGNASFEAVVLG